MAQLKSLLVSGPTRLIGDSFANKIELTSISAPTSSGGTIYGLGSNGQVLKSNGSSVYWTSLGNVSTLSYGSDTTKYLRNDGNWSALPTANNSTAGITKLGASGGAATYGHIHGNLTNDGKIGTTTDYAVYTTTGGAITAGSLAVTAPTASGTATAFISSVSQNSKGQISASKANLPTASTSTAGIIQIGTGATNAAAGNHTHTTSLATDTGTATVTLAHNTTYKLTAGGTSVIFKMPSDNNTDTKVMQGTTTTGSWRKILLNGGSDTVYSAWDTAVGNDVTDITYRTFGVAVQPSTNTLKATNLEADKTIKVGTFTIGGNTDELTKTISSSSTIYVDRTNASVIFKYNGTNKIRIDTNNYLRPEADNTLQLGDSSYRWNKIYGTNIYGALIGNVTGNVSGSSSSCTGNAATATEFSSNATVKLTGDVTGETSAKKGWAVATTLASVTRTNNTSTASPSHGGNFTVIDSITTDTKGRVTAVNTKTVTLPSDNNTWNALSTSQAGYVSQAPNNTTKFLRGDATWAQVSEASLTWGGQNFSGNYGCIDAAMVDTLGANRLMFLKPAGISIKYTRDGGSTWTDYGATDTQKRGLFAAGYGFAIGKADSTNKATANGTNYQLEVVIDIGAASVYTVLNKFVIYISTNGSSNCTVTIQKALQSTPSTYIDAATNISISGWSGYNVINVENITAGTGSGQYGRLRFLFKANGGNTSYNGLTISQIMGFGGVGWATPSTMAKTGHLYSYDNDLNATFPAKVTATSFSGNADSATKATQDESGNNIKASYASSFSISDHTITLKNKNGESLGIVTVPDDNTTYTFANGTNGNFTVTPSGGSAQTVSIGKPATAGTADSANSVAWDNVTGKPIALKGYSGALNSEGWKTMGGLTNGSKIYIAYNNNPANWNSSTYSATMVWGCSDTRGLLDCGHNSPIVTFGGSSTGNSTDNDPKWYFKLSGTSGQIYTFPTTSKTLVATDGTGASGTWNISISGNAATATTATNANNVKQNDQTGDNDYRLLLSGNANDTPETTVVNKSTNLKFNPSTKILKVGGSVEATGNLTITGNSTLSGETSITSLTAGSLLVNGNANFVQIPTAPTPVSGSNDTQLATTAFVTSAVTGLAGPMRFIGSLGTGGTATSLAAASDSNKGYAYKVITAGTYQSVAAKVGDMLISNGSSWILIPSGDEPSGTVTSITLKAGNGITLDTDNTAITSSGTRTISHADTSSVENLTANGRKYVTGLTFDTYGHVTGYTTGTETVTNTNFGRGSHTAAVTANEFALAAGYATLVGNVSNTTMPHNNNANAEMIIKTHSTSETKYYEARLGFSSNKKLYYMPVNDTNWKQIADTDYVQNSRIEVIRLI